MLTEILRREPTALSWTARAGGFVVPPPTRPHSFSLVVRICRLVGERGVAFLRIFPALVFLIVVRMLARPAFGHSIKCSPDSPWAIDEFAPERRRTPALPVMEGCATIRREPCWQFGERKRSNGCDPIDGVRVHPTFGRLRCDRSLSKFKSSCSPSSAWRESSVPLPLAHPFDQNVERWAGGINQMPETTHETFAPLPYSGMDRHYRK